MRKFWLLRCYIIGTLHTCIYICVCVDTDTEVVDIKRVKVGDPAGTWQSPMAPITKPFWESGDYIWGTPTRWEEQSYNNGFSAQMADK